MQTLLIQWNINDEMWKYSADWENTVLISPEAVKQWEMTRKCLLVINDYHYWRPVVIIRDSLFYSWLTIYCILGVWRKLAEMAYLSQHYSHRCASLPASWRLTASNVSAWLAFSGWPRKRKHLCQLAACVRQPASNMKAASQPAHLQRKLTMAGFSKRLAIQLSGVSRSSLATISNIPMSSMASICLLLIRRNVCVM